MSVKVTTTLRVSPELQRKLDAIGKQFDKPTAEKVGQTIVDNMLSLIASGSSPIKGKGKFPAYKNPDKYPGKLKPKSPVNLRLSGDFLDSLDYKVRERSGSNEIIISYSAKESVKERGHREGANRQPSRPTLPERREKFAELIEAAYIKIIEDRINKLAKS